MRYLLTLLVLISGLVPLPVSAHVLKTDGDIGGVLHIDPNDNPTTGSTTTFFFEMRDRHNQFTLTHCDCQVIVTENGKQLSSKIPSTLDTQTLTSSFNFPEKAVYQLTLSGKPTSGNTFQPFTLTWSVRVASDGGSSPFATTIKEGLSFLGTHFLHLGLIVGATLIVLYQVYKEKKEEKAKKYASLKANHPT